MSSEEPTKLKFHEKLMFKKKKHFPKQASLRSNYSLVSLSDVTDKSLEVWQGLPDEIRADPTLAPFKNKHETIHGNGRGREKTFELILYLKYREPFRLLYLFQLQIGTKQKIHSS